MDEESKDFNVKMFQAWEAQRRNWRPRKETDEDQALDECEGQVLSPREDTVEGKEKVERREKILRAETLSES